MDQNRRNVRQLEANNDYHHAAANNNPNRLSTADSGRGSMATADRPTTTTSRATSDSVSSPFSTADTPLNTYDNTVSDKKSSDKPIRIPRTHIVRGKQYEQAFVSHVDHPSAFFLQLAHFGKTFKDLHKRINEYYSKNPMSNPSKIWKRGEYCIAKFTDNVLYRARIIETPEVTKLHDQYDVVFVDYGNWDKVNAVDIHILLPQFATLSAQAVPCSLSETLPRSETWFEHKLALDMFKNLVYEKYVDASFVLRNDRDCWPLNFVDLQLSSNKAKIRDLMLTENLVRKESNDRFYIEFSRLFQRVDYLIYNIRFEDAEIDNTDDDDDGDE